MLRIKLINMPFADVSIPSIALTQLKSVTEERFKEKVDIEILYLNHDFGNYFGIDLYRWISNGSASNNSGFGDWLFRQEAFPELSDNTHEYLERYGNLLGADYLNSHGATLLEKRRNLKFFLTSLIEKYNLLDAEVVGFTSMFMQQIGIIAMVRLLKSKNKNVITLLGGANCETPMGEEVIRNVPVIDYVFSGGALISFPAFVQNILDNNLSKNESINGLFTHGNIDRVPKIKAQITNLPEGVIKTAGPIGDELPIDACVPLDYDYFLRSFDSAFDTDIPVKPYLLFETSRGCWWGAKAHCTFCGLNGGGMTYRAMKSENAIRMLNGLFERYGDRIKHFSCVDNIIPKEYIKQVFPNLRPANGTTMFYEVKADLSSDDLKILSNSGVNQMQPGIESLATSTLKLMKKGTSSFNNIRFLQDSVNYSISPSWNLLIGFPGEDENVYSKYFKDLPFLYHLPPPQGVFPVRFDRYSPYFNETEKYNLNLQPLDYYNLIYPFSEETIRDIAYYFSDHNFDSEYIKNTAKWIRKLESRIISWRSKWEGVNEGVFPKLFMYDREGMTLISDSRSGEKVDVPVSALSKEILRNLSVRKNLEGLKGSFPKVGLSELETSVDNLTRAGFLFEENATYMSLVFETEPFITTTINFH